ncbi:type III secretion protein HrpB4 [Caldimonas brevitalea]|uniref:Uncharacterized protein n=1 Tax=Caldimonas brevitalea TaxID=413882 RepID=A0A0G3BKD9_9BURK|nr:type III secretion protein HrpB4 [Caldimonas brevitalea]AKJ27826.1 hypothetical protein AAW51_1135 [Caldimonas brevitalea]
MSTAAPVLAVTRLLQAIEAKAAELASHLHPAWLALASQQLGPLASALTGDKPSPTLSRLIGEVYGIRWPALPTLAHRVHRLVVLGRADVVRVLSTAALHARRDSMRRCIGRDLRRLLVERVGEVAYRELLARPGQGGLDAQPLEAAELHEDRLSTAGYRLLCEQGAWHSRQALAIARLSLAPAALDGEHVTPLPSGRPDLDSFFDHLPHYFPEHAWLFGSDMDRALSA